MRRIALLLIVLVLAGNVLAADLQPSDPSEPRVSQVKQQQSTADRKSSNGYNYSSAPSISTVDSTQPNYYSDQSQHQRLKESFSDYLIDIFTGLLVVVGAVQAAFFFVQLRIMKAGIKDATTAANASIVSAGAAKKSADISEKAMVAGQRAFVFATGFNWWWEPIKDSKYYGFRLRPNWENSGNTPTKNLIMYVQSDSRNALLKPGEHVNPIDLIGGPALIPPRSKLFGGEVPYRPGPPITVEDILAIQKEDKFFYMWGWVKYEDVFTDIAHTPHVTKFCWRIVVAGNPKKFKPHSTKPAELIRFDNIIHPEGNCADEECETEKT